jgi:hypothetical protein
MNMETKVCKKCLIERPLDEFYLEKKLYRRSECKTCSIKRVSKWVKLNVDKKKETSQNWYEINSEKQIQKSREWRKNNPEKIKDYSQKWYQNNSEISIEKSRIWKKNNHERVKEYSKKYRENNDEKIKESQKKYQENNLEKLKERLKKSNQKPKRKMSNNVRRRLNTYLKLCSINKVNKTFDIVGCTPGYLKEHLEKQFKEGMTWGNYGFYGWHIDHIIPLSSAKTEEEIYKLCHYTNLQPLWAKDNMKKSNKIINELKQ